jgi:hypothetical protein
MVAVGLASVVCAAARGAGWHGGRASDNFGVASRTSREMRVAWAPWMAARPIPIRIGRPPPNSDGAAFDTPETNGPSCSIHRPCFEKRPLAPCPAEVRAAARPWSELAGEVGADGAYRTAGAGGQGGAGGAAAAAYLGHPIRVRGRLRRGRLTTTLKRCAPGDCCNGMGGPLVIGEDATALALGDLICGGDESRICCDIIPDQPVVATGILQRGEFWQRTRFQLKDVELCRDGP